MRHRTPLALLVGLCLTGCYDYSKPLPGAPLTGTAPAPLAPLTADEQQKVVGTWKRQTLIAEETLVLRADGSADWLERIGDRPPERKVERPGLGDRPLTYRFKDGRTIELMLGGNELTEFKDVQVTDDQLTFLWLASTLTWSRAK